MHHLPKYEHLLHWHINEIHSNLDEGAVGEWVALIPYLDNMNRCLTGPVLLSKASFLPVP
jgi:hypothetical protein